MALRLLFIFGLCGLAFGYNSLVLPVVEAKCPVCPVCPTLPSPAEGPKPLCKPGWTYNAQTRFCYKAFVNTNKHPMGAENVCRREGAHLTSIHSAAENSFVASLAKAVSPSEKRVCLGEGALSVFSWSDGTVFNYTNWAPNISFNKKAAIMMIMEENANLWYTFDVDSPKLKGIQPTIVCKNSVETRSNRCTTGWSRFGNFAYCAIQCKTWAAGKAICAKEGGHLASVHSNEENEFVSSVAEAAAFDKHIWLGGQYQWKGAPGIRWTDGTPDNFSKLSKELPQHQHGAIHMRPTPEVWSCSRPGKTELTIVCKKQIH